MTEFKGRSVDKTVKAFTASLCKLNLITSEQTFNSDDPLADLDHLHNLVISILSSHQPPQVDFFQRNEAVVLECIGNLSTASEELLQLSTFLYGQFPLPVLRSFRKVMQSLNTASYSLFEFQPLSKHAEDSKTKLLTKNLELYSQIQNGFQQPQSLPTQTQSVAANFATRDTELRQLKMEVEQLQQLIKQNDEEFAVEIQKYNHAIVDLQETLRQYEVRLDKSRQLEGYIERMEHQMIRMKEEKSRDDMLIDNMSKKIRLYEKERGGSQVFLSPRQRKMMCSPSSRFRSPNLSAINSSEIKRTFLRTEETVE